MAQGTVKEYDIDDQAGSLLMDDRSEITIDAVSTEGSVVRYLRVGQRVVFDVADEGGQRVARNLKIISFA
jgi:cold shock CspA family protein